VYIVLALMRPDRQKFSHKSQCGGLIKYFGGKGWKRVGRLTQMSVLKREADGAEGAGSAVR